MGGVCDKSVVINDGLGSPNSKERILSQFWSDNSRRHLTMATRQMVRYVSRRFSTGGKVLGKEEKVVENVYIKGPKPEETPASSALVGDAKASESTSAKVVGVSTDMHKNYAIVAGVVTGLSSLGWYLLSKDKMTLEDLHD